MKRSSPSACLQVYVDAYCPGCVEARRLAREVATRYPHLEVEVVELGDEPLPEAVVAVPTYLLDGVVVSLGNPAPEELFARLDAAARPGVAT